MIINATPHPIVVRTQKRDLVETDYLYDLDTTFATSGILPRVATIENPAEPIEGFPCVTQSMGEVEGLPAPVAGTYLVVSAMVFGASDRRDLIAPDTGKGAVRDDHGRIVAVTRFLRRG